MPLPNRGDRCANQLGQHRRRIEPLDPLPRFDQPQPRPQRRLADQLNLTAQRRGTLQRSLSPSATCRRNRPIITGDDHLHLAVNRPPRPFRESPLRLRARHAGQLANQQHPSPGNREFVPFAHAHFSPPRVRPPTTAKPRNFAGWSRVSTNESPRAAGQGRQRSRRPVAVCPAVTTITLPLQIVRGHC